MPFHRAEFQSLLSQHLDPAIVTSHFSKRLVSYSLPSDPSSPITLHFKDGTTATCDVLVGADGIHSATRHTLLNIAAQEAEAKNTEDGKKFANELRGKVDPVWSGSVAYRSVIPKEVLAKINPNHPAMTINQNVSFNSILSIPHMLIYVICFIVYWKR